MRYGFFDANIVGYDENNMPIFDRAEDAEFFSEFFDSFLTDGIYSTPANGFKVTAGNGLSVNVAEGRCLIKGHFGWADEAETLTFAAADSNRGRCDRVVIRLNLSERNIVLAVKQGEYASSGYLPPELTRDIKNGVWELGIANVNIPAATAQIDSGNIVDTRANKEVCGFVTSIGTLAADAVVVTIAPEEWSGTAEPYEVTKTVDGITATANIVVSGAANSMQEWIESGCYAAEQGDGTVTFKALYKLPEKAISANILIVG